MTLQPGEASGPFGNEHPESEQVLFVHERTVQAQIGDETFEMRAGGSAIVPRGTAHRFVNRSPQRALTFNVYAPKAY